MSQLEQSDPKSVSQEIAATLSFKDFLYKWYVCACDINMQIDAHGGEKRRSELDSGGKHF